MNWFNLSLNRRRFLQYGAVSAGLLTVNPWKLLKQLGEEWPDAERLGRICVGKVSVRSKPSADADEVGVLYEDGVVTWLREVLGAVPTGRQSARWVETPEGYIYAPSVQPVDNLPNIPVAELPQTSLGKGMWVEISIPHTQIYLENNNPVSEWLKYALEYTIIPRLYYSQVVWVDDMKTNSEGQILYRINERYGLGDLFWTAAEACRPLTDEELTPISADIENKKILADVTPTRQMLSLYENDREVYTCQISSGAKWNSAGEVVEKWGTPVGQHFIWRKAISIHMSGGQTGTGYDLPGIAWTTLFTGEGVAIHSTFWHNDYGTPRSHGCINASPEDAKYIFRWTLPQIAYDPGDLTVGMPGGTLVDIQEA